MINLLTFTVCRANLNVQFKCCLTFGFFTKIKQKLMAPQYCTSGKVFFSRLPTKFLNILFRYVHEKKIKLFRDNITKLTNSVC